MHTELIELLIWRKLKSCRSRAEDIPSSPGETAATILGKLDLLLLASLDNQTIGMIDTWDNRF